MGHSKTSPLIRKQIQRAYELGEGSYRDLSSRFKVSLATVQRCCKGITPAVDKKLANKVLADAVASRGTIVIDGSAKPAEKKLASELFLDAVTHGEKVTIDGLDLKQYLKDGIQDLTADMRSTEAKSKEGVASAALKYMQFYAQLNPPTLEEMVDQLLARPDFDPERFVSLLRSRYAAKAS